jgi:hypothetical protein
VIDARLKIALAIGLLIGAAALGVTLSQSPLTVARANVAKPELLGTTEQKVAACQTNEVLPRGTSAIRLRSYAFLGPRVTVEVWAHKRMIAHGEHGSGWTGGDVTIPVHPLPTTISGVELCFAFFLNGEESGQLVGEPTGAARAARGPAGLLPGREGVEYMRPGRSSWWSLAPAVARRLGLGRAWSGTWNAWFVIALMCAVVILCSRAILRELR